MTEDIIKRSRGTWRRRILIILLAVVLVFLLGRVSLDLWAGSRVSSEVARLEQKYGSLDPKTMVVPAVPEGDNRGRALRAASGLITGRDEMQPTLSDFTALSTPAPVPAGLRAFVAANQEPLRVARESRSRSQSNWEADYSSPTNVPSLRDVRSLSDAIYLATRIELDEGRPEAAADWIATGLALSESVRQEPSLIVQLIRIAVGGRHFEAVQRLIIGFEPSPPALEALAKWLADNRAPDPMHVGLLSELKYFNGVMSRVESQLRVAPEAAAATVPTAFRYVPGMTRPMLRLARLRYLETMGHLLDLQTGARPRPAAAFPKPRWSFLIPQFHVTGEGLERAMDSGDIFRSQLAVTEVAVALRRFRLDRGHYPESLDALVPVFLTSLPIDPVTGKPPVYTREGAGFRLHAEKGRSTSPVMASLLDWKVPK